MNDTSVVIPAIERKLRIVFVIPTLDKGGAERVLVNFVNQLDLSVCEPVIFCLKKKGDLVEMVNPGIPVIDINRPRTYFSMFKISREIKKINPDAVIGWLGNINAVMAFFRWLFPGKLTVMCRESSIPSLFNYHYRFPFLFNFMYRFYNRFDGIICQSQAMKEDLVSHFKVLPGKITIINNPVNISQMVTAIPAEIHSFLPAKGRFLLFVGRFSKEKQIELLLELLVLLPADYKLLLVGYGSLEVDIRSKINSLNISERVKIVTNCSDPAPYYRHADCLLLCSAFEGFPNVLLEANAQGCPAVVYKTLGGAKEILTGSNGIYIMPGEESGLQLFADTVAKVCNDKKNFDRETIAAAAQQGYGIKKITDNYLQFIKDTVDKNLPGKSRN